MTFIDNMSPEDLLLLTNILAVSFLKDKTADEINVLGNFIVGIGCLMLTMASQQQYLSVLEEQATNNNNSSNNGGNNNNDTQVDDIFIG